MVIYSLRQCCDHHCLVGDAFKPILEGQPIGEADLQRLIETLRNAIEENEDWLVFILSFILPYLVC